jgi:hypothetical protein
MIDILFDRGIDRMGGLVDAAEAAGVVVRKGAWYYYGEMRLGQVCLVEELHFTRSLSGSSPSCIGE